MSNSIVCSTFNVKCSWEGLPEERNCFCVWSFRCSELCSVDQAVAVQRECAGFEGSGVILPALLLTLDKYSSWRVGRVVPMIRSAVRTTLRSLLRSDLVAELNQTDVDVQRTDSMMAEKNCFSSSSGRLHFLSWRRKYNHCWDFFYQWSLCDCPTSGPERLWCPGIWMTPLQSQCCSVMVSGRRAGGFLLMSTIISTVLSMLSSRLLRLHQTASCLTSSL